MQKTLLSLVLVSAALCAALTCSAQTLNDGQAQLSQNPSDEITRIHARKNALKTTILSIGSGATKLTYERAFTPHFSTEVTAGRIGWGFDTLNHTQYSRGGLGKVAAKYTFARVPAMDSWLTGIYLKSEFEYTNFNYLQKDETVEKHTAESALMCKIGYQIDFYHFVFDAFSGCGYAWGTGNDNDYFHGFLFYKGHQNFAISMGFRIGFAF
jgi:hypothetical protein